MTKRTGFQFTATKGDQIYTEREFYSEMSAIKSAREYIALGWSIDYVMHSNTSIIVKCFN